MAARKKVEVVSSREKAEGRLFIGSYGTVPTPHSLYAYSGTSAFGAASLNSGTKAPTLRQLRIYVDARDRSITFTAETRFLWYY